MKLSCMQRVENIFHTNTFNFCVRFELKVVFNMKFSFAKFVYNDQGHNDQNISDFLVKTDKLGDIQIIRDTYLT